MLEATWEYLAFSSAGEGISKDKKDWWKLAAVAAVAVALAGLGTVIASNLAPSSASRGSETAQPNTTTAKQTLTTIVSGPAATTSSSLSSSTTIGGAPAFIEPSDTILEFGDTDTTHGLDLTNTGETPASWTILSANASLTASPSAGEIEAGEVESVSIVLDRQTLDEGELDATLTLTWDNSEQQIFVRGVHAENPIIIGPTATPSIVFSQGLSTCSPAKTTITVRVKDTSELAGVLVRWTSGGDGGTVEVLMTAVDEENYQAVIGPFTTIAPPNVKIVARDIHDNAGGAAVALVVAPCP